MPATTAGAACIHCTSGGVQPAESGRHHATVPNSADATSSAAQNNKAGATRVLIALSTTSTPNMNGRNHRCGVDPSSIASTTLPCGTNG
jgi:hypothetical protein